jgi:hypothetical protein
LSEELFLEKSSAKKLDAASITIGIKFLENFTKRAFCVIFKNSLKIGAFLLSFFSKKAPR